MLTLLAAVIFATCLTFAPIRSASGGDLPATRPAATLTPQQVVQAILVALQHNDVPAADAGIATTFEFASPGNKSQTGPVERFTQMVYTPAYAPMLNFKSADYGPMKVEDGHAVQTVKLVAADGSEVGYVFGLSKQADGPYAGCWMTDAVIRLPPAKTGHSDDDSVKT